MKIPDYAKTELLSMAAQCSDRFDPRRVFYEGLRALSEDPHAGATWPVSDAEEAYRDAALQARRDVAREVAAMDTAEWERETIAALALAAVGQSGLAPKMAMKAALEAMDAYREWAGLLHDAGLDVLVVDPARVAQVPGHLLVVPVDEDQEYRALRARLQEMGRWRYRYRWWDVSLQQDGTLFSGQIIDVEARSHHLWETEGNCIGIEWDRDNVWLVGDSQMHSVQGWPKRFTSQDEAVECARLYLCDDIGEVEPLPAYEISSYKGRGS